MEKNNDDQLKRELAFDLYGRYAIIRDIINNNRKNGEKFRVLDVGGRGNMMKRFLPSDDVFYLDPFLESDDKNFIKGDGCNMLLGDESFDWLTSADVFEHIPKEKKEVFLSENIRVAKLGVILTAPFWSKEVEKAEHNVNESYRFFFNGEDHMWLKEHIENGLPMEDNIENYLNNSDLNFQKLYNNGLFLWQNLMGIIFFVWNNFDENLKKELEEFNYFYNSNIFPYDSANPSYRKIYFIKKDKNLENLIIKDEKLDDGLFLDIIKRAFDLLCMADKKNKNLARKEIELKSQELENKSQELENKKQEIEKIKIELRKEREKNKEIDLMKSSKFWKIRNFYLKIRHYFIFIFLNPRKFANKQFNKFKDILNYYKDHGFYSTFSMICRKILPKFLYRLFHGLFSIYLRRNFTKKDNVLIVFPVINWNSRWQRPQQILSRFAKDGYKIIYLQMAIVGSDKVAKSEKEGFDMLSMKKMNDNVYEVTLSGKVPFDIHSNKISPDNLRNFTIQMSSLFKYYRIKKPIYMVHFPNWSDVVFSLKDKFGGTVVFDCMDDHSGFSTAKKDIVETEEDLIKKSDIVFSSSKLLLERNLEKRKNSVLIKNGTEYAHFNKIYKNGELDNITTPIIGYYGAINDWFDMEIVKYCAENRPKWKFVLIGGTDNKNFEKDKHVLDNCKNVIFLGEKKYSDLPGYIGYFDVCTIPFKLIPLTMATNPVKFYEYISSGKPVVSVELPELFPYRDICYLARSKEDFLDKLENALAESSSELIEKRMVIAKENSWDARYMSIKDEIIKFNKKK